MLGECTFISARCYPNPGVPEAPLGHLVPAVRLLVMPLFAPLHVRFEHDARVCGVTEWPLCPEGSHSLSQVYTSSIRTGESLRPAPLWWVTHQPPTRLLGPNRERWSLNTSTAVCFPFPVGSCDLTESQPWGNGTDTRREAGDRSVRLGHPAHGALGFLALAQSP